MTSTVVLVEVLSREAFMPFGAVIEACGEPSFIINRGRCERFHDLARPELHGDGDRVALSIARSQSVSLPMKLEMMERHPLGSQAFVPMNGARLIITVAEDNNGAPGIPRAFLANGGQGIQYRANTWHGVLAPLEEASDFLIVDRIGSGSNLEEYIFTTPYTIAGAEPG